MSTAPTDSVLRRHHEQMRETARLVPTDSVLRRHYGQMQQAARSGAEGVSAPAPAEPAACSRAAARPEPPEPPPAPESPPASRPAQAPAPAASQPASPEGGGGFFGWLKRLFGG